MWTVINVSKVKKIVSELRFEAKKEKQKKKMEMYTKWEEEEKITKVIILCEELKSWRGEENYNNRRAQHYINYLLGEERSK